MRAGLLLTTDPATACQSVPECHREAASSLASIKAVMCSSCRILSCTYSICFFLSITYFSFFHTSNARFDLSCLDNPEECIAHLDPIRNISSNWFSNDGDGAGQLEQSKISWARSKDCSKSQARWFSSWKQCTCEYGIIKPTTLTAFENSMN